MVDEMLEPERCRGLTPEGRPCEAPAGVVSDGWCPAHGPGARERMAAIGRRGGEANRHLPGLSEAELPEPENVGDCQALLFLVARSVATGRISDRVAAAMSKALAEWIRGHQVRISERLDDELAQEIAARDATIAELEGERRGLQQRIAELERQLATRAAA